MPAAPDPWPLPGRLRDYLRQDTPRETLGYWVGLTLVSLSVFIPRLLPCVDYPQHLALSRVAMRLRDPASDAHAMYVANYKTYNGLFHVLASSLGQILPLELAGRVLVSFSLLLLGASVLALLRTLRRPTYYASFFVPALFSFSATWGFVNYILSVALSVLCLVVLSHVVIRPRLGLWIGGACLGLITAHAHVLGMLVLCFSALAFLPELAFHVSGRSRPLPARLGHTVFRSVVSGLPLLLGCFYCLRVYREQYAWDPAMYTDPAVEGTAPPLWQKVLYFGAFTSGLYRDATDQVLLWIALAVLGVVTFRAVRKREPDEAMRLPFVFWVVAYLATPMVFVGTHLIFPRLGQGVVLAAVFLAPRLAGIWESRVRRMAPVLSVVVGVNLVLHMGLYAWETDDASRVINDLPSFRKATAVVHDPMTRAFRNGTLVHLAGYYAARKSGEWAFSFARYLSVPIRFRPGAQPPWPEQGWEFEAHQYNPRCRYARTFDLVLVKAPNDLGDADEAGLRRRVFRQDAESVKLLSHHGRYWAFDTQGLPHDGTL